MKLRNILLITLAVAAIIGGILLYRHFKKPPTPPTAITTPTPPTDRHSMDRSTPQPQPPASKPPQDQATAPQLRPQPPIIPDTPLPPRSVADWVLVEKKERRLTLFHNQKPLKSYDIALGRQPTGPKQFEGDNKTPEGRYIIDTRKENSSYHRALHISYPNARDAAFAAAQQRSAGGAIMIHGLPNGMGSMGRLHLLRDWTAGCIAVTNNEIEELWRAIPNGTPIEIRP